ncbi:TPA: hypothetical protein DEW47_01445 [Patescibacteria group bacterium]|nr:MAG: Type II secretion system protein G [Parcubacteria group bacterium GW2011_GWF2_40_10]KKR47388.1 MAG: Type II secretion system protein G [Parcubacteria group bacterium GW2011_GWA2_40_143]KKR59775.1 MAG: Type II secretion system protein G [Parcubacteria group bacterium GW2011_GWC2_40_31]KKR76482.1 MAG: Type II secretion system protein G [Parcubacteria group bacterium GW2011_GWE2_40_8]KKR82552.1 MAG: Type II secretion system protein G [Parcubacteria group bacterium GW2011_GWD2_40_9]HBB5665
MKNAKGFTLIELLVVIAIIGILSSVVLASLNTARVKARDARRQSDLSIIRTALELYYSNKNAYPVGGAGSDRDCWVNQQTTDLSCNPLGALIIDGDIPTVAYDPGRNTYVGSGCGGAQFYAYWSDGQQYLLGAVNESQGSSGCTQVGNWGGPTASSYTYQFYLRN